MADAMKKHPQADVLINFASLRSAFESTMETMTYPQVKKQANAIIKSQETCWRMYVNLVSLLCYLMKERNSGC